MSSADREDARAGELIERLLVDPRFRAEFRRDPSAACLAAGLPDLAAELAGSGGSMDTLVVRESRSSLAGVVMAVAVEGMGVAEAKELMHHGLTGAPRGLKLPHGTALHSPLPHVGHGHASGALQHELNGLARAHASAPPTAPPAAPASSGAPASSASPATPEPAAAPVSSAVPGGSAGAPAPVGSASAAPVAPAPPAAAPAPPDPGAQPAHGGVVPKWPDQPSPGAGTGSPPAGGASGSDVTGAAGGGAVGTNALTGVLDSPRLSAAPNVRTFLASGGADPRMVSVLGSALANHTIGLGGFEAVSDPVHAQAFDIVSVDGQPVGPSNVAARDLVTEIAAMDPSVRPNEIGTPWPISSPGFFTDAGDRLHLGFEMPGTDSPPGGIAGPAAGGVAPSASGQVAYPAPAGGHVAPIPAAGNSPAVGTVDAPSAAGTLGAAPTASEMPLTSVAPAPIAAATPGSGVDAALAYAHAMIGKLPESAGSNLGPQLDRFEADFGFHGAAWCGIFAGHVLEAAGLKPPHSVAAVASILDLARNGDPPFVKGILPVSEAQPGDLVTFGGTEHVAVVTKVDAAGVHTIAGNTSQSNVSETTYSPSSVTGVVRPDYAAGTPGSIPGVWNYAGVQPPSAGGAAPNIPAPVGAAPPAAPEPSANAPMPTPEPAAQPQPGTIAFNPSAPHARIRNTVQFLPAVRPGPGSPLFDQAAQPAPGLVQEPAAAPAPQPVSGGLLDQVPAAAPSGASISVSSPLLTSGQAKFAGRLAELTGLDPRVVAAWELAEESGGAAQGREAASNFNWLNIGYFDSGAGKIAFDKTFGDPVSAAEQTAKFLKGEWGGASSSIRAILGTVGHSPDEQMAAIANSDWASSHYGGGANLHGTYNELGDIQIAKSSTT